MVISGPDRFIGLHSFSSPRAPSLSSGSHVRTPRRPRPRALWRFAEAPGTSRPETTTNLRQRNESCLIHLLHRVKPSLICDEDLFFTRFPFVRVATGNVERRESSIKVRRPLLSYLPFPRPDRRQLVGGMEPVGHQKEWKSVERCVVGIHRGVEVCVGESLDMRFWIRWHVVYESWNDNPMCISLYPYDKGVFCLPGLSRERVYGFTYVVTKFNYHVIR